MAATGDGFLRGVFEGCISGGDMGVQRRPYHKNCGCALHASRGNCPHPPRYKNVSYPIRRSWSEGCLAIMGGQSSPSPSSTAPAAAPAGMKRTPTQLVLSQEEGEVFDSLMV
ncbi:hypothetical protein PHJA_002292300 [Phtheirospermum japonicum]|uniref:Uncharacterized protein n=1 Tax=Phtheirospermum japonicum TaxID=374723 RepID=A0A830D023_9LAMI|nr:hypothetical protein PHJA_002292300 [Phtheirospermum japonicum]